jgi:nicotinate-nucleotide adenylyltransferase
MSLVISFAQAPCEVSVKRIGIFGGTFDPVHLGHLLVAVAAREEMLLDQLVFVPASRSPFKPDRLPAPDALRLRMLRLALVGLEWSVVSDLELRRGGVSYTVDTARAMRERCREDRLFLLIGEDQLAGLPHWREAQELWHLVEFLIIPRPGSEARPLPVGIRWHRLRGWPVAVSSSEVRQRLREGRAVDHLVPPPVAEVIRHNRLYLD